MPEEVRLQKYLSQAGVASRRKAEELIAAGRVRVNGRTVTEMGVKVDPAADAVEVDGREVEPARTTWVALHKPPGYVSTRSDTHGRPTIYELLPRDLGGLFYVGRLDADSEGLMLLTNEGDVAHRLLHPSYEVDRVYDVYVEGAPADAELRRLTEGVALEDGVARAVAVERLGEAAAGQTGVRLTLREGRKREVRRMMASLGCPVRRLVRRRYGPVELGDLAPGAWRRLTRAERAALDLLGEG